MKNNERKDFAHLVAGTIGGATSTTVLYPLDLIKVRLQVNEGDTNSNNRGKGKGSSRMPKKKYINSWQILRSTLRRDGIKGLYQGLIPALMGTSIAWGGYFFIYEEMKIFYGNYKYSTTNNNNNTTRYDFNSIEYFIMACTSGAVLVGITNPFWLIKTRMQLQLSSSNSRHTTTAIEKEQVRLKKPYKGLIDAARTIIREEGATSLYKGVIPALLLTSHGGVQFAVYEYLKRNFHKAEAVRDRSLTVSDRFHRSLGYLTMGAISKIIASTTTYPLQVIKSRIQQRNQNLELKSDGKIEIVTRDYHGVVRTARTIFEKEGIYAFFNGAIPNAIRVAPSAAITFVVYETVLDTIKNP